VGNIKRSTEVLFVGNIKRSSEVLFVGNIKRSTEVLFVGNIKRSTEVLFVGNIKRCTEVLFVGNIKRSTEVLFVDLDITYNYEGDENKFKCKKGKVIDVDTIIIIIIIIANTLNSLVSSGGLFLERGAYAACTKINPSSVKKSYIYIYINIYFKTRKNARIVDNILRL
jgi:hypothetical protein